MKVISKSIDTKGRLPVNACILDICTEGRYWRTNRLLSVTVIRDNTHLTLLAEKESDEYDILTSLNSCLETADTLITFNGRAFDLPFLHHKYAAYGEIDPLSTRNVRDLFWDYRRLADLLSLPSRSLASYSSKLSDQAETMDDAEKTLLILEYDALLNLFNGDYIMTDASGQLIPDALVFTLHMNKPFHGRISLHDGIYHLTAENDTAVLCAHQRDGKLRFYHEDVEHYYYLPLEGYSVHASLADSVDKSRKEKAVRENCFHLISDMETILRNRKHCETYIRSALRYLYPR